MNGTAIFDDEYGPLRGFCAAKAAMSERQKIMNGALAAFVIGVGGTSLIAILVARIQSRQSNRRRSRDSGGSDGGGYYASGDSGSHFF